LAGVRAREVKSQQSERDGRKAGPDQRRDLRGNEISVGVVAKRLEHARS